MKHKIIEINCNRCKVKTKTSNNMRTRAICERCRQKLSSLKSKEWRAKNKERVKRYDQTPERMAAQRIKDEKRRKYGEASEYRREYQRSDKYKQYLSEYRVKKIENTYGAFAEVKAITLKLKQEIRNA